MSFADRLKEALTTRGRSTRSFQRALAERGTSGSSEPAVYRYLRGESEPSFAFVETAAEILNVRPAWLAFGVDFPDDESQRLAEERALAAVDYEWQADRPDRDAVDQVKKRGFVPAERHVDAVARFHRKLLDADYDGSSWGTNRENHVAILIAALEFLMQTDMVAPVIADRDTAETRKLWHRGEYLLTIVESAPDGWYVAWSDAVLHAFSLRVYGLGVHTEGMKARRSVPHQDLGELGWGAEQPPEEE